MGNAKNEMKVVANGHRRAVAIPVRGGTVTVQPGRVSEPVEVRPFDEARGKVYESMGIKFLDPKSKAAKAAAKEAASAEQADAQAQATLRQAQETARDAQADAAKVREELAAMTKERDDLAGQVKKLQADAKASGGGSN